MTEQRLTPKQMMELAVKTLVDKKAKDIKVLQIEEITTLADYFIIANGTSLRQLRTLTEELSEALEAAGEAPPRVEGYRNAGGWTLVDFGAIAVHLFTEEVRKFYDLERLWGDAKQLIVENG